MKTTRNIAIVVAAGAGSRFGGLLPKQFMALGGKPMVVHSLDFFERNDLIDEVIFVVSEEYLAYASQSIVDYYELRKIRKITCGGQTRQESVLAGLSACPTGTSLVAIHDAARPFLTKELFEDVIAKADQTGAAILAVKAKESVKLCEEGMIGKSLKRDSIWLAQTPQVFRFDSILDAHKRAAAARYTDATDDAELYEHYIGPVSLVPGSYNNIKITTPADLILAQEILKGQA